MPDKVYTYKVTKDEWKQDKETIIKKAREMAIKNKADALNIVIKGTNGGLFYEAVEVEKKASKEVK